MLAGILTVTEMALRIFWRDKHALFWGIAFPLMLMGLIGTVFSDMDNLVLRTAVVIPDGGNPLSQGMLAALEDVRALEVVVEDEATALAALRRGDRSLVVVLPGDEATAALAGGGTSAPVPVRVYYDEARMQVAQAGLAIVNGIVHDINQRVTGRADVLAVEAAGVAAEQLSMFDFLLPGILAMGLMQSGLMGVSAVITAYRERLLLKRVLATPFPPAAFLAGLILRFTITNVIQGLIIVLVGVLVFGARVVGSYVHLLFLVLVGSVVFLTIGFAISTVSRTAEAANTMGSAVAFPMMFLSGTFWPRELIPQSLQPLIDVLPLTPLVEAMRAVVTQGESLAAHAAGLLYLGAWAVAAAVVAVRRFRWE
ncbi:MAG TPA: ABC transporter permease [Limnochordales bacterium]|nr:ABC transporter permease [Limnochordales bacterium]